MLKRFLVLAGALAVLAAGALALLVWLVDTARIQGSLSQAAGHALGRPVRFARLSVSVLPVPSVRLRGLEVADDPRFGATPFLTVAEARMRIRVPPLLWGRVELADVRLEGVRLVLAEEAGQWNVASLGAPPGGGRGGPRGGIAGPGGATGAAGAVSLAAVRVVGGTVALRSPRAGAGVRLEQVTLTVTPAGRPDAVRITGEAVGQPGGVRIRVVDATLALAGARAIGDMAVSGSIEVEVPDVAALAPPVLGHPAPTGPLGGALRLSGTLARLQAAGEVHAARLLLPPPRPACARGAPRALAIEGLRAPVTLSPAVLESGPAALRAAGGAVSARLAVSFRPRGLLTLRDIRVQGVDLGSVLLDYLCEPYAVSGPLELSGEASMTAVDPWGTLAGSGRFRVGRGRVVGPGILDLISQAARAGGALAAAMRLDPGSGRPDAPPDFDAISGTYRITAGVLSTDDLVYDSAGLRGTAAGTYRIADGRLDAAVVITQGATQVRARVAGTPGSAVVMPSGVSVGERSTVGRLIQRLAR